MYTAARFVLQFGLLASLFLPPAGAEIVFETLGTLPGNFLPDSEAHGVNADGSVVVGSNSSVTQDFNFMKEAFRWKDGVMEGLGDLPGGDFESEAHAVSADGSVVVGTGTGTDWWHAFRWENGNMTDLGARWATGVSADGSVVAGFYPTNQMGDFEAAIWVNAEMTPLGDLAGGSKFSQAWGISADGTVVVGGSDATGQTAFRWKDGVMTGLESLPVSSRAFGVNADGSVVVGECLEGGFRWENGAFTTLSNGIGLDGGGAQGVSGDGSIVVGIGLNEGQDTAIMWSKADGFVPVILNQFLDSNGISRNGWYLETAMAISTDGTTIVGRARHDDGSLEAYRLRLKGPPEWAGFPIFTDGHSVDTGDFIGWIDIMDSPWVYVYALNKHIYAPEEYISPSGGWVWIGK